MADVIKDELAKLDLADLTKPAPPATTPPAKLTAEKVQVAVPLLVYIEDNGGYLGVAKTVGIQVSDVKAIELGMRERIGELTPDVIDIEEVIK